MSSKFNIGLNFNSKKYKYNAGKYKSIKLFKKVHFEYESWESSTILGFWFEFSFCPKYDTYIQLMLSFRGKTVCLSLYEQEDEEARDTLRSDFMSGL